MLGTQEGSMRSIRPYKTSEQYLYAMKEDLAEWLRDLYGLEINVESFLDVLETGVLLCHHANGVTQLARELSQEYPGLSRIVQLPKCGVACNDFAQPGTFQARDNVSNFIRWCRQEMAIQDVLMFETEDLVLRKNEKHFVLCLLEVARRASRFGMSAPTLIQMEEEIEEEIREDLKLPREEMPLRKPLRKPADLKNLDQMVQHFISRCTCPVQFSMVKVSEGKYRVGDSSTLIFVRILRKHVMVRVGGGWDTLEHYLDKHDPCRCTSLSHKQALKMAGPQKTPAPQVQHEIASRFTPGKDQPHQTEPAFVVRRSQSPLPLVEWRTYAPRLASLGRRPLSSPGPNQKGSGGSVRKVEGQVSVRDPSEPRTVPSIRGRERSVTPLGGPSPAEEKPGSKHTFSAQGRRETSCGAFSQQNRSAENNLLGSKCVPELRPGRTGGYLQTTVASQNKKAEKVTSPGTPGPNGGLPVASGKLRQELKHRPPTPTRSSSPSKEAHASFQQAPGRGSVVQPEGAPAEGGRKDPRAGRAFSPVKQMGHLRKEDSGLKASGQGGSMFHRPPTPSKSCEGGLVLRNGGSQTPKDETGSQKEKGEASNGCPERARVGCNPLDVRNRRKNIQTFLGETHPPEHPCNDEERSQVDTKEPPVEKERVYTPLSINLAEEQALYQSLEDEIMANIKDLEEEEEEKNQRTKESQGRGLRTERALGRDTTILGWNGQRLPTPSFPFWPSDKGALDCVGGVPRSGVYLPERETRWHPAGLCYEAVLRELSVTLHREQAAKERPSPARSSSPESGRPGPKNIPEGAPSHEDKPGAPQTGDGKPPCTTNEGRAGGDLPNGDATQATPSTATSSVESLSAPEKGEGSPGKPRRALKKPERVPSIYKLKLRPRCRPRRDHRPEKGPSKIPTPVAYRRVRRTASLKSPSKPKSLTNKPRERGTLNMLRAEDQPGLSSPQDEERTVTEEDAGVSDDEESWV